MAYKLSKEDISILEKAIDMYYCEGATVLAASMGLKQNQSLYSFMSILKKLGIKVDVINKRISKNSITSEELKIIEEFRLKKNKTA